MTKRMWIGVIGLSAAVAITCTFSINPNQHHFSCVTDKDCGAGYGCHPQADGGALCFVNGACSLELCNGLDDDCDGVIDNGFDLQNDPNNCGACNHVCDPGNGCRDGGCYENNCFDGLDNDHNGLIDCQDPACLAQLCTSDGGFSCQLPPDGGLDAGDGGMDDGGFADGGTDAGQDGGFDAGLPDGGIPAVCQPL